MMVSQLSYLIIGIPILGYWTDPWYLSLSSASLVCIGKPNLVTTLSADVPAYNGVTIETNFFGKLVQVMACCLAAPSHNLNQCWLIISKVLWHSAEGISQEMLKISVLGMRLKITNMRLQLLWKLWVWDYNCFENYKFEVTVTLPRGQWVNNFQHLTANQMTLFIAPDKISGYIQELQIPKSPTIGPDTKVSIPGISSFLSREPYLSSQQPLMLPVKMTQSHNHYNRRSISLLGCNISSSKETVTLPVVWTQSWMEAQILYSPEKCTK